MARARKSKTNVKVNFKGVESRQTPPEGDYIVEVLEAKSGKSGNGNEQIEFALEIAKGKYKSTKLWLYCPLQENSLWKLHAFLTALGQEVPEDEMDIDLSELVGEKCVGVLTHEVYNGRKRAKMTDFDSLENYSGDADSDDDDDEDDGKKSKSKKGKKAAKADEPDYDEMDEDELRDLYIERELGTKKAAKKLDEDELKEALEEADEAAAKKGKGKKSKSDDDDDDDEDDKPAKGKKSKKSKSDDDDDDDDKPAKGKKGKKAKKPKKLSRGDVEDMDEDELQELIDEHDLDVDLDDFKKLPKKVSAVIDALEEEDLLEDEDDD